MNMNPSWKRAPVLWIRPAVVFVNSLCLIRMWSKIPDRLVVDKSD